MRLPARQQLPRTVARPWQMHARSSAAPTPNHRKPCVPQTPPAPESPQPPPFRHRTMRSTLACVLLAAAGTAGLQLRAAPSSLHRPQLRHGAPCMQETPETPPPSQQLSDETLRKAAATASEPASYAPPPAAAEEEEKFDPRIILYVSLPAIVLIGQLFFTFSRDAFSGAPARVPCRRRVCTAENGHKPPASPHASPPPLGLASRPGCRTRPSPGPNPPNPRRCSLLTRQAPPTSERPTWTSTLRASRGSSETRVRFK